MIDVRQRLQLSSGKSTDYLSRRPASSMRGCRLPERPAPTPLRLQVFLQRDSIVVLLVMRAVYERHGVASGCRADRPP